MNERENKQTDRQTNKKEANKQTNKQKGGRTKTGLINRKTERTKDFRRF